MSKLDTIRKYAEELRAASVWSSSRDAIADIEAISGATDQANYVYEFYCIMRVITDLARTYDVEIKNTSVRTVLPKSPQSKKKNFPYFEVRDKNTGDILFQVVPGVKIIGDTGTTDSPDIQFHEGDAPLDADYKFVFMCIDAKYRHSLSGKITKSEFQLVSGMVVNLDCTDNSKWSQIKFDNLVGLNANCILTNGGPFTDNPAYHQKFWVKEVANFTEGKSYTVYG